MFSSSISQHMEQKIKKPLYTTEKQKNKEKKKKMEAQYVGKAPNLLKILEDPQETFFNKI